MGGAVSSGRDNDELVDNLKSGNYIRSRAVERVFRVLDRADYMCAEARDQAYKDLAWRNGPLHLSAPCIYSEVMEALELKRGLSFLNVGSGTGYLSTLVGLIIGSSGISHGVEALPVVLEYANKKLSQFIENSNTLDEFDFCIPKYYTGNGLCLAPASRYDRVYCGAGVLAKYADYFKQLLKVGGVLVMPLADTLVQCRRLTETHWVTTHLLNVSFARLRDPSRDELDEPLSLDEHCPAALQSLCRAAIRSRLRAALQARQPELREPAPAPAPPAAPAPRRICIPLEPNSDEELNELHELDAAEGGHEMNALLSLVLSMGQNRAAGSLRFDHDYEPHADPNLNEREGEEGEGDAISEDDIVVFDVGFRAAMRARRRARPRPQQRDVEHSDSSAERSESAPERNEPASERSQEGAEHSEPEGYRSERRSQHSEPEAVRSDCRSQHSETEAERSEPSASDSHRRRRRATDLTSQVDVESPAEPSAESSVAPASSDSQGAPESAGSSSSSEDRGRAPPRRAAPPRHAWGELSSALSEDCTEDELLHIKDTKRQKLDSGIGEGTASSGASPGKSPDQSADKSAGKTSPVHSDNTDDDDEADTDMPWAESECCGSSGSDSLDESEAESRPRAPRTPPRCSAHTQCLSLSQASMQRRRRARRWTRAPRPPAAGGGDRRRAHLALAMKRALKELPLPHPLKKYLNYGRCYQI